MASEAESVVTAVGNTSAFGATTSSPPFTKDGLPLPPTEQHQFFKISTGGDRVARLVVFDLLRMAMLIETKQRGDVERDGKRRKSIRAESMQDLRRGPNSEIFKENIRLINDGEHEACFTVFYVHQGVNSNVNLTIVDAYLAGLEALRLTPRNGSIPDIINVFINRVWTNSDLDQNGYLSVSELVKVVDRFNIADMGRRKIAEQIETWPAEYKSPDGSSINFKGFVKLFEWLRRREDVRGVFASIAVKGKDGESVLPFENWKTYMRETQKSTLSDEELTKLFAKYTQKPDEGMTPGDFNVFTTLSSECLVYQHKRNDIWQDMTKPLSNYWIATSHNTYLTDNQLTGAASMETYVRYLVLGSRVIELDTWERNGEPVITHGHTLTEVISWYDVIRAAKDYAFRNSRYPVILDHELHVSPPVLSKMAKFLHDTLGDALYVNNDENLQQLPSPEELQGKFIIKDGGAVRRKDQKAPQGLHPPNTVFSGKPEEYAVEGGPMPREFAELVFLIDQRFATIDKSKPPPANIIFERDESVCTGLIKTDAPGWATYAANHIVRVYPEGLRVYSTNMNPIFYWGAGFQMCAINLQTFDKGREMSDALFASNGYAGYTLKPEFLRPKLGENITSVPNEKWTVKVKVISAAALQKPRGEKYGDVIDPYVEIDLIGQKAKIISTSAHSKFRGQKDDLPVESTADVRKEEESRKETEEVAATHIYHTSTVRDNGWDPTWNEEITYTVERPDIAFLRFVVRDDETFVKDKVVGSAMLHLPNIRDGYRVVPLFNWRGFATFASLFVKISISK